MSTAAGVAGTATRGLPAAHEERTARPLVRLCAFTGLALYGALRWSSMLSPAPNGRMVGLVALALVLVLAWNRTPAMRGARVLVPVGGVLGGVVGLAICGIPVRWITHLHIAAISNTISDGLNALPRVLVPYDGLNPSVRIVIVLGAALLLLSSAIVLCTRAPAVGELRRVAAAIPLIALATAPEMLERSRLPYLQGVVLFVLLAAFAWGERVQVRRGPGALALLALGAAGALLLAPAVATHKPWLNYEAIAGRLATGPVDSFDWTQRYGPLSWPRDGREVLDVKATTPEYWKAEDLDVFDQTGWSAGAVQIDNPMAGVSASARARFTQTLQVTIRGMQTSDVIAPGVSSVPQHLASVVLPGASPGTWTSASALGPGDSYTVSAYSPHPSPAQLAAIPAAEDQGPQTPSAAYRAMVLPGGAGTQAQPVVFAPFTGGGLSPQAISGLSPGQATASIASSPYGTTYALAQRLAAGAATPYAYLDRVQRYLAHGYRYTETPPRRTYPIPAFLFSDKAGYCQQFAGAMALLLRMGGIPARVAVGFTPGTYDSSTRQYMVSDIDAHAWVEAWFPRYGWIEFDPTPTSDPALGGVAALPTARTPKGRGAQPRVQHRPRPAPPASAPRNLVARRPSAGSSFPIVAVALASLAVLAAIAMLVLRRRPTSAEGLVRELEQALRRCGRPAPAATTLNALEHRFRRSPEAAAYIRSLRLLRYGPGPADPSPAGRRALRSELRAGLGPLGALRALWALPPRAWTRRSLD